MHDPTARPAPRIGAVVELLAGHGVRWVLTGSCVLAACGAPIAPNDVDVTPDLTPDNLVRLAGACLGQGRDRSRHQPKRPVI